MVIWGEIKEWESSSAVGETVKNVFQTNDIQIAVIVFVKFVASKAATNSTN